MKAFIVVEYDEPERSIKNIVGIFTSNQKAKEIASSFPDAEYYPAEYDIPSGCLQVWLVIKRLGDRIGSYWFDNGKVEIINAYGTSLEARKKCQDQRYFIILIEVNCIIPEYSRDLFVNSPIMREIGIYE